MPALCPRPHNSDLIPKAQTPLGNMAALQLRAPPPGSQRVVSAWPWQPRPQPELASRCPESTRTVPLLPSFLILRRLAPLLHPWSPTCSQQGRHKHSSWPFSASFSKLSHMSIWPPPGQPPPAQPQGTALSSSLASLSWVIKHFTGSAADLGVAAAGCSVAAGHRSAKQDMSPLQCGAHMGKGRGGQGNGEALAGLRVGRALEEGHPHAEHAHPTLLRLTTAGERG